MQQPLDRLRLTLYTAQADYLLPVAFYLAGVLKSSDIIPRRPGQGEETQMGSYRRAWGVQAIKALLEKGQAGRAVEKEKK